MRRIYTEKEKRFITMRFNAGDSDAEIAEAMPGRTASRIASQRQRMDLLREAPKKPVGEYRPPKKPPSCQLSIRYDPMILMELTKRAQAQGIARERYIRRLTYRGLEAEKAEAA